MCPLPFLTVGNLICLTINQMTFFFLPLKFKKKEKKHSLFPQRNAVSWLTLGIVVLFSVLFSQRFEMKHQLRTILEEYNSRVDHTLTIVEVRRLPAGWIGDHAKANMRLKVLWSGKSDAFIRSEGNIGEGSPWRGIFSKACCENLNRVGDFILKLKDPAKQKYTCSV